MAPDVQHEFIATQEVHENRDTEADFQKYCNRSFMATTRSCNGGILIINILRWVVPSFGGNTSCNARILIINVLRWVVPSFRGGVLPFIRASPDCILGALWSAILVCGVTFWFERFCTLLRKFVAHCNQIYHNGVCSSDLK